MKLSHCNNFFKKIFVLLIVVSSFTNFTGCSLISKNYENKKYYAVNSILQSEIIFPKNEELKKTNYLIIKKDVLYFCKDEEVINFYKLEIIDDSYIFFESESVKGQIKENCIEIYYGITLYYYAEDFIKQNNSGN